MKVHHLKTWPPCFEAIQNDLKHFELRKNDRDFQVGDMLVLQEWNPHVGEYTTREIRAYVQWILQDVPQMGLMDGFCIMEIDKL
jgi:hypothetical protein